MAFDGVPWAVENGAKSSAAVARSAHFAATHGRQGVTLPGDLKVAPTPTASQSVRIATGSATLLNQQAAGESYHGLARSTTDVAINVSGSARNDMVIGRIIDPDFAPWQPSDIPDAVNGPYWEPHVIEGVSSTARTPLDAGITYSAIALARIAVPASGNITGDKITDLRELREPRSTTDTQILNAEQDGDYDLTSETFAFWPASGNGINSNIFLPVPEWATVAFVSIEVNSYAFVGGDFIGELRILLDTVAGPSTAVDLNGGDAIHASSTTWAQFDVTGFQGQDVPIALEGKRWPGYVGVLRTRPYTQYVMRTDFYERVV